VIRAIRGSFLVLVGRVAVRLQDELPVCSPRLLQSSRPPAEREPSAKPVRSGASKKIPRMFFSLRRRVLRADNRKFGRIAFARSEKGRILIGKERRDRAHSGSPCQATRVHRRPQQRHGTGGLPIQNGSPLHPAALAHGLQRGSSHRVTSVRLSTFRCPREGASVSPSAAAMYTSVRVRENSRDVPWYSILFHVQNASSAAKCEPHLVTSSRNPIRTVRLRRLETTRGTLCRAK